MRPAVDIQGNNALICGSGFLQHVLAGVNTIGKMTISAQRPAVIPMIWRDARSVHDETGLHLMSFLVTVRTLRVVSDFLERRTLAVNVYLIVRLKEPCCLNGL